MALLKHEPVTTSDNERAALKKIDGVLKNEKRMPRLVGPDGEEIELPGSLFQVLQRTIYHMLHGRDISIVPIERELTTEQAADLLNISRPSLVNLLEKGEIPFHKVGTHRRISLADLMIYKAQRAERRALALAEMVRLSEEMGLYEEERRSAEEFNRKQRARDEVTHVSEDAEPYE
ncbi:MAG TPA: helix-turn-helix domain-containing protein [Ktedonosporobacter sp.]|nr:helix-turn-helix domain-containing protein [Ktedonosporobacter sp.]